MTRAVTTFGLLLAAGLLVGGEPAVRAPKAVDSGAEDRQAVLALRRKLEEKKYLEALREGEWLLKEAIHHDAEVAFLVACAYAQVDPKAVSGDAGETALKFLEQAVEYGFRDFVELEFSPHLEPLRKDKPISLNGTLEKLKRMAAVEHEDLAERTKKGVQRLGELRKKLERAKKKSIGETKFRIVISGAGRDLDPVYAECKDDILILYPDAPTESKEIRRRDIAKSAVLGTLFEKIKSSGKAILVIGVHPSGAEALTEVLDRADEGKVRYGYFAIPPRGFVEYPARGRAGLPSSG
jgi:hypothetical protein